MSADEARPLSIVVTSMWPSRRSPEFGIFVKRHVDALRHAGVEVEVVALTESRSGKLRTPRKYLGLLLRTIFAVKRTKPDLIVGHYLVPTGDITRLAAMATGVPYVVVAHGSDVRRPLAAPDGSLADRTRRVVTSARGVIAVSNALAADLRTLAPEVDPAVCDMGIDTRLFTPPTSPPVHDITAETDIRRLLAVGSLTPDKNHAALIRAVAKVFDTNLVIVGEGPTRAALETLIAELGLRERVALAGRVPPAELSTWYGRFDATCLPSLVEGYGLAALESLACGTPVLVSQTAPVSELVTDPAYGSVVDPTDAASIAAGIEHVRSLPRLTAAAAAAIVAGRSIDEQAARMRDLLAEIAHSTA